MLVARDYIHDNAIRIAYCTLPHPAHIRLSVHVLMGDAACPGAMAYKNHLMIQHVNLGHQNPRRTFNSARQ